MSGLEAVFLLSAFLVIYPYVGYPLVIYALAAAREKKVGKKANPAAGELPTMSLIISAYNEEGVIAEKIDNSLGLDYPREKLEIIVASESSDGTNATVQRYADAGVRLFAFEERQGKAATLYRTVPRASGRIIVFSDANGMYERDALLKLARNFSDPRVGCVSGLLRYMNPGGVAAGEGEGLYWSYEMMVKALESRLFSFLGATGSIFAIRSELYSPLSRQRGDDFELSVRIAQQGYGVVFEPEAVSWEMSSDSTLSEFRRKVRIVAWNIKSALLLLGGCFSRRMPFLAFQLLSHKILRWMVPVFLLSALVSNMFLEGPLYGSLLVIQGTFYLSASVAYALDLRRKRIPGPFNVAYYFCVVNLAALVGVFRFLHGEKATWEKVRG
jgi:biofilm PGA synthesis N-glycosyltransferase PgaC